MRKLQSIYQQIRRIAKSAVSALAKQYRSLHLLQERRLAILSLGNLLDVMSSTIFVPFIPTLAEELGASPFIIGLIFTVPAVVGAVVNAPAGYLSDRLGRRPLISIGVTLSSLPVMAIAFAWSPLVLIVLRAFDALLRAFVDPAMHAYLGDTYSEEQRGSAFGIYQTTGMIGAAAGPIVGGAIAAVGGVRVPFLVLGAGTLVGGFVLLAFLPPVEDGPDTDEDRSPGILPDISRSSIGVFLTVPSVAWLGIAFTNEFGTTALDPIFALLLEETVAGGPAYVGATYSSLAIAMLIFMPIGGRFADQFSRIRLLVFTNFGWFVVLVGLALVTSPLLPPVLMFLGGVLSAFAAPASLALRYELAPDDREATFSGITGTASSIGKASGPMFAGIVTGALGVRTATVAAGLSWLISIPLLIFFVPETRNPDSG